ncbi:MAG: peptide-methionine (R)-S-oxide reductase MsrB [Terricaulis sp.]
MTISRRTFFLTAAALPLAACAAEAQQIPTAANEARYANDPFRRLTEAQWRARLEPQAFRVLRQEATERAGTSPLDNEHRRGTFVCAGCELELFRSEWKFNSGTGWPSFFRVNEANIGTKEDVLLFTPRTEYHCARCLGHQGHVFEDGPRPTGLRYCNNGAALRFAPH